MRTLRRLLAVVAVSAAVLIPAAPASAHGENSQESFLRMGTIAYWDVKFSDTNVSQGEEFKLTGTAKVLETWPEQLADPKLGFIGLVAPGPVVLIKERKINGVPAPHAIDIEKGGVYQFEMTLVARRPGHWHIHPIFGVHGAGSLLGPGRYITVKESASGFSNNIQLTNGKTVDLENFGIGGLWFWSIVWLVMGLIWLLYWIVPKRTVTRLQLTGVLRFADEAAAENFVTIQSFVRPIRG